MPAASIGYPSMDAFESIMMSDLDGVSLRVPLLTTMVPARIGLPWDIILWDRVQVEDGQVLYRLELYALFVRRNEERLFVRKSVRCMAVLLAP